MTRRGLLIAAMVAILRASTMSADAAQACAPVEVIRQRFIDDGGSAAIISDPRGVDAVTEAIKDNNAAPTGISDRYLVVAMRGVVLIYPLRDGQVCAVGKEGVVPIMGPAAADLVKRLQATCGTPL